MIWQYIAVGVILLVVAVVIIKKMVANKRAPAPDNPFCAGCALAKNCKKSPQSCSPSQRQGRR